MGARPGSERAPCARLGSNLVSDPRFGAEEQSLFFWPAGASRDPLGAAAAGALLRAAAAGLGAHAGKTPLESLRMFLAPQKAETLGRGGSCPLLPLYSGFCACPLFAPSSLVLQLSATRINCRDSPWTGPAKYLGAHVPTDPQNQCTTRAGVRPCRGGDTRCAAPAARRAERRELLGPGRDGARCWAGPAGTIHNLRASRQAEARSSSVSKTAAALLKRPGFASANKVFCF